MIYINLLNTIHIEKLTITNHDLQILVHKCETLTFLCFYCKKCQMSHIVVSFIEFEQANIGEDVHQGPL